MIENLTLSGKSFLIVFFSKYNVLINFDNEF